MCHTLVPRRPQAKFAGRLCRILLGDTSTDWNFSQETRRHEGESSKVRRRHERRLVKKKPSTFMDDMNSSSAASQFRLFI